MNQMSRTQINTCRRNTVVNEHPNYDVMSQTQLWNFINEVSFAADDILLYLDTHPHDPNALSYAREKIQLRKSALEAYAKRFAPLTVDCTADLNSNCWLWITQSWPWESAGKGGC